MFCELLENDKLFSIHHKNIQRLIIEILHNFTPCIMNSIFQVNQTIPYDLRKRNIFQSRYPNSVKYGTEIIYSSENDCFGNNRKLQKSKILQTKNKKVEACLPIKVMQSLFATSWFHLIIKYLVVLLPSTLGSLLTDIYIYIYI